MREYTKLVEALRLCQFGECGCGKCYYKELKGDWCTEDNHPEFFDCDDKLKLDAADAIEALQAQLPKRGKFVYVRGDGVTCCDGWECSVCGKTYHTNVPYFGEYKFCPNCGAKMEETEDEVHSDI